jgi:hypothetical protein
MFPYDWVLFMEDPPEGLCSRPQENPLTYSNSTSAELCDPAKLDEEKSKYAPLAQQIGFDPAVLYRPEMLCDPANIFLTSKFCYLSFSDPTHKNKNY